MSGHSKWSTIKRKKGANDAKRGKIFTKLIKEITIAARMGGGDPEGNPRLRSAITVAKGENMPKENIDRAIKKGTGDLDGAVYEEIMYEGYGPGGVAVLVETMTDNKNRTVADIRHFFAKSGGNLGESGCVAWMFDKKGTLTVARDGVSEEELMDLALEAGAEDVVANDDGSIEVITGPWEFTTIKEALEKAGFTAEFGEVTMKPENVIELAGDEAARMQKLLDALEGLDDVQEVYTSAEIDE